MRLLNINCFAEGYYSGATYEENIIIPADTYDRLSEEARKQIKDMEIYVGELDGKHSEAYAKIGEDGMQYFEEDNQDNICDEVTNDGDYMYEELKELFRENNLDLDCEIKKAKVYIDSLDGYVTYSCRVRKSKLNDLKKYISKLKE